MPARAAVTVDVDTSKGRRNLDQLSNAARGSERQIKSLQRGVLKLAAAYVSVRTVQSAFQAGIRRIESGRRLKLLSKQFGETAKAQEIAAASSKKFGLSLTDANQQFADIYGRLRTVGVGINDIETAFNGFNTAAKLSGLNAAGASAAFLQLSQALGSGVLQGDELRTLREQTPLIMKAIADEMGVAVSQIKELGSQGKITSEIVLKALSRVQREGADQLAGALGGPAQAIKDFQNATENLSVAATETLIPGMSTAFRELAVIIKDLEGPIKFISGLINKMLGGISRAIKRLKVGVAESAQVEMRARREAVDLTNKKFGRFWNTPWGNEDAKAFFKNEASTRQSKYMDELLNPVTPPDPQGDKTDEIENQNKVTNAINNSTSATKTLTNASGEYKHAISSVTAVVRDGLVDALEGAIMKTKSLSEVASSTFRMIARMFLQLAVTQGMSTIGIPMKAAGGPVSAGGSYIVGEQGPELFTPKRSGSIIPNHQLGGGSSTSVVVNVDATGSSVEGDEPSAQQLGRMIAGAVQAELIRQKRPGGLLTA